MKTTELRQHVEETGSLFFTCSAMKCFGDTMRNYGCRSGIIDTPTEKNVPVWILRRMHPVKDGLQTPAYFRKSNYARTFSKDLS